MIVDDLHALLNELEKSKSRSAGEVAFALASQEKSKGNTEAAKSFAAQSISIFEQFPADTQANCAADYTSLNGIAIPSLIHADLVRSRFQ